MRQERYLKMFFVHTEIELLDILCRSRDKRGYLSRNQNTNAPEAIQIETDGTRELIVNPDRLPEFIDRLAAKGLIEQSYDEIRLTEKGIARCLGKPDMSHEDKALL